MRQNSKCMIVIHEKSFTKKNTIPPRGVTWIPANFEDEKVLAVKVLLVQILE